MSLGGEEDRAHASLRSYPTSAAKGKTTKRISCEVSMRVQSSARAHQCMWQMCVVVTGPVHGPDLKLHSERGAGEH